MLEYVAVYACLHTLCICVIAYIHHAHDYAVHGRSVSVAALEKLTFGPAVLRDSRLWISGSSSIRLTTFICTHVIVMPESSPLSFGLSLPFPPRPLSLLVEQLSRMRCAHRWVRAAWTK